IGSTRRLYFRFHRHESLYEHRWRWEVGRQLDGVLLGMVVLVCSHDRYLHRSYLPRPNHSSNYLWRDYRYLGSVTTVVRRYRRFSTVGTEYWTGWSPERR